MEKYTILTAVFLMAFALVVQNAPIPAMKSSPNVEKLKPEIITPPCRMSAKKTKEYIETQVNQFVDPLSTKKMDIP